MSQGLTAASLPAPEPSPATRLCGRCRETFDGDPTAPAGPLADWWVCPECRSVLLPKGIASAEALARAGEPR